MDWNPDERPRLAIARWVRAQIEEEPTFKIPDLADRVVEEVQKSPAYLKALLKSELRPMIGEMVKNIVRESRGGLVEAGDEVIDRAEFAARSKISFAQRFSDWYEHVGDRHIALLDMTREELVEAAGERRQRANTELEIAELWERLASQLTPEQKLGAKFSTEQIAALARQIRKERKAA